MTRRALARLGLRAAGPALCPPTGLLHPACELTPAQRKEISWS